GLKSVSIISSDGTLADGLSTALFVMGPDAAAEYWRTHSGFDVIFVTDDNRILITEGIEDIFESPREYSVINR
ncbi:MAG: FAD:protein FMN transferase, partial [Candidatus Ornithomonoglobus sp.]